ncbi:hypothetical protein FHX41_5311 [Actinomadura hallensis]|uniref:DUF4190 domain-containing protein n=1 Tax=Actinomadura hallensis TaxID=337895 RepID=A0A543ILU8_9ACTN|nr:DUF4190 domain-containing protein [Actinomadura hallensis]TQM71542.1 hypothetical protein FHX41_5311 [Actinomadura hallensis]HLV72111.1 DUF4190 domain-containing protein [Vulgatibacteraceae bacterium]
MSEQPGPPAQPEDRSGERPAGQPPTGPTRTQRAGWRALWLGGIALLTSFFFYPLGLVLGVASLVVGVRARRAAREGGDGAPGALPGIVLGSVGLALSVLSVSMTLFLWSELSGYQDCLSTSNTKTDEQACQDEYYPKIEEKLGLPEGSMKKYGDIL